MTGVQTCALPISKTRDNLRDFADHILSMSGIDQPVQVGSPGGDFVENNDPNENVGQGPPAKKEKSDKLIMIL